MDDLAAWIDLAGRTGITGPVNAVGEEFPLAAVLAAARDAAAHDTPGTATETVTLDDDIPHRAGRRLLGRAALAAPVATRERGRFRAPQ